MDRTLQRLPIRLHLSRSTQFYQGGRGPDRRPFARIGSRSDREAAGKITSVLKSEWIENMALGIVAKPLSRHSLKNPLQRDEIDATVETLGSWPEITPHTGGHISLELIRSVLTKLCHKTFHVRISVQSGRMGQEIPDNDIHGFSCLRINPRLEPWNIHVNLVSQTD